MTRWLVTGAGGMLGRELVEILRDRDLVACTREQLDITNRTDVEEAVQDVDVVINAAAWTDVDGAESQVDAAWAVNETGPRNLARACKTAGARLLHVSTDYVFGGEIEGDPRTAAGYAEDASPAPRTQYGRTKLAGERSVLQEHSTNSFVVRTAWLYGEHGQNFVATMLRLERTRPHVDVVDDQWGQPTWAHDLAVRVIQLADSDAAPGVYHLSGEGRTTWCGLARAVFAAAGADPERVRPITTDLFPRPAPRPSFSVLGQARAEQAGIRAMPPWEESIRAVVPRLSARLDREGTRT